MRLFLTLSLILLANLFSYSQNFETEISASGVCFPQMTTEERDLLTPISGQCIFNTETKVLECYVEADESWTGIQSLLSDADGDTQVLVEQLPDQDIIHMIGNGQELLTIRPTEYGDSRLEPAAFGYEGEPRNNIFYGAETGHNITTGINNITIGAEAAVNLSSGRANTVLGRKSGMFLNTGSENTFVGLQAGQRTTTGYGNTYVGSYAGDEVTTGNYNTYLGAETRGPTNGGRNVFLGYGAGNEAHNANNNVYIGMGAGSDADGNNNVFIGYGAGYNFNTSSKLAIETSAETNAQNSLIYGDFEEDFVTINGTLHVTDLFKLKALETSPLCDEESPGALYLDAITHKLNLCTVTGWRAIALEP